MAAPATATGSSTIRPLERNEPNPEPTAIETAKMARYRLASVSVPPSVFLTSEGRSDITTAPTIQNSDTIMPVRQRRESRQRSAVRRPVERARLGSSFSVGSAAPVAGIKREAR